MIKDVEFYHGVVLERLIEGQVRICITEFEESSKCSYVLDDKVGIYIKHSSNRMSPWTYNFTKIHQDVLAEMATRFNDLFVLLVCGRNGIVCLNFNELKTILNTDHRDNEWIKVSRGPREKYAVCGTDGKLKMKIAESHFPSVVHDALRVESETDMEELISQS